MPFLTPHTLPTIHFVWERLTMLFVKKALHAAVLWCDTQDLCFYIFLVSPTIEYICCNVTVLEKERRNVTMSCNATGRPAAQLSWIRAADGKTLVAGNTLVISAAGRSHRGEYRCVGDNGVRSPVSKSAYVNVLCKFRMFLWKSPRQ